MMTATSHRSTERLPLAAPPAWKESLHDLTGLASAYGVQLEDLGPQSRPTLAEASHDIASRHRGDTAYQADSSGGQVIPRSPRAYQRRNLSPENTAAPPTSRASFAPVGPTKPIGRRARS
jgi:hypothetical protein